MSFLSLKHVTVKAEQPHCQGAMAVGVFVLGEKLIQRSSRLGSADTLSAELGAPDRGQIILQDCVSSRGRHSPKTLNISVLGEKKKKGKSHFSRGISPECFEAETVTIDDDDAVVRGRGLGRKLNDSTSRQWDSGLWMYKVTRM